MRHKNRIIAFLTTILVCCCSVSVFAQTTVPITITSGCSFDTQETISTFSDTRTIYGEAKSGTTITISVKPLDTSEQKTSVEEFTVGIMGIFATTVELSMGQNEVTFTAQKDGYETVSYTWTIKRVPQQIKTELQNLIALPGWDA